jgi:hypothetical protein
MPQDVVRNEGFVDTRILVGLKGQEGIVGKRVLGLC